MQQTFPRIITGHYAVSNLLESPHATERQFRGLVASILLVLRTVKDARVFPRLSKVVLKQMENLPINIISLPFYIFLKGKK